MKPIAITSQLDNKANAPIFVRRLTKDLAFSHSTLQNLVALYLCFTISIGFDLYRLGTWL